MLQPARNAGNADGLGRVRSKELYRACSILGVSARVPDACPPVSSQALQPMLPVLLMHYTAYIGNHGAPECLQIEPEDVVVVDDARLPDGMHQRWQPEAVAEHVAQAVQRFRPDKVCSLAYGNGCAAFQASPSPACLPASLLYALLLAPAGPLPSLLHNLPSPPGVHV